MKRIYLELGAGFLAALKDETARYLKEVLIDEKKILAVLTVEGEIFTVHDIECFVIDSRPRTVKEVFILLERVELIKQTEARVLRQEFLCLA